MVLQQAPSRKDYDGFPGYPIQPLAQQVQAIEILSGKPVVAITINHENLADELIPHICQAIATVTGLPAFDVLRDRGDGLAEILVPYLKANDRGGR